MPSGKRVGLVNWKAVNVSSADPSSTPPVPRMMSLLAIVYLPRSLVAFAGATCHSNAGLTQYEVKTRGLTVHRVPHGDQEASLTYP
jgi:hypothetical protein